MIAHSPLLPVLRARGRSVGRVVLYHRVVDDWCDPDLRRLLAGAVTKTTFGRQLDYLRRHYRVVALDELLANVERPANRVAITFDDGYADNLHNALPLLQARGMPATVFVVAGFVGSARSAWWDRLARQIAANGGAALRLDDGNGAHTFPFKGAMKQMSAARRWLMALPATAQEVAVGDAFGHDDDRFLDADELSRLERSAFRVEAHTFTHARMTDLDEDQTREELARSRSILEPIIGRPLQWLAYPFGERDDFTPMTRRCIQHNGFRAAFAAFRGVVRRETDLYAIPRIATCECLDRFKLRLASVRGS